jgi:hypothetical protein
MKASLLFFALFFVISAAQAQSPEVIKRRLTQSNWMSGCAEEGQQSTGMIFSLSKEGSGFLVNYIYEGQGCSGLPKRILRAAVEFRTADSETVKGAVDFVFQPIDPPKNQPTAYAYRIENGIDGTLVLTHTRFVIIENGKPVSKEPVGEPSPQAWYAVQKGLTVKTLIESRLPNYDRQKMDRLIDDVRLRSAGLLPYPALAIKTDLVETTDQTIAFAPNSFLQSVNLFLFGRSMEFGLVAGKKRGLATLDPQSKRIAVDPLFGDAWQIDGDSAQAQTELSILHEVARYLYEFYLQSPAGKGLGPHGRGTSYVADLWESLSGVERTDRDLVINKAFEHAALQAEVDVLGMSILLKMGADVTQLRSRFEKRSELLANRAFGANMNSTTEVSFVETKEFIDLIELSVREKAVLKYLRQY